MHIYTRENKVLAYGAINKIDGQRLDVPQTYHMRALKAKDVKSMVGLSLNTYKSLKEGQECFIHQHDEAYYAEMLKSSEMLFVGAFDGKKLIAMSYVRFVDNKNDLFEEFPTNKTNFLGKNLKVACFGADSVDPSYRGNNLNASMIAFRSQYARLKGARDFVSIIDRKNVWNMRPYFANDFVMMGSDVDPADNGKIALMHRKATRTNTNLNKGIVNVNVENYNLLDKMFDNNRVAVGYDFQKNSLQVVVCLDYGKEATTQLQQQSLGEGNAR